MCRCTAQHFFQKRLRFICAVCTLIDGQAQQLLWWVAGLGLLSAPKYELCGPPARHPVFFPVHICCPLAYYHSGIFTRCPTAGALLHGKSEGIRNSVVGGLGERLVVEVVVQVVVVVVEVAWGGVKHNAGRQGSTKGEATTHARRQASPRQICAREVACNAPTAEASPRHVCAHTHSRTLAHWANSKPPLCFPVV